MADNRMTRSRAQKAQDGAQNQDNQLASNESLDNVQEGASGQGASGQGTSDSEERMMRVPEERAYCVEIRVEALGTWGAKKGETIGPPKKHHWKSEVISAAFFEGYQMLPKPEVIRILNRKEAILIWGKERNSPLLTRMAADQMAEQIGQRNYYMGNQAEVTATVLPLTAGWEAIDEVERLRAQREARLARAANNNNHLTSDDDPESDVDSVSTVNSEPVSIPSRMFRSISGRSARSQRTQRRSSTSGSRRRNVSPANSVARSQSVHYPELRREVLSAHNLLQDQHSVQRAASRQQAPAPRKNWDKESSCPTIRIRPEDVVKNPKLPRFGNKEGGTSYEVWKSRVNTFRIMENCPDSQLLNAMLDSLRGTPEELASQSRDPVSGMMTIESVLQALDSHLGCVKDMLTLKDEISAVKMTGTESVSAYSLRLDTAIQRLIHAYPESMSEEYQAQEKKCRFFHGLRTNFKNALSFRYHDGRSTFDDMLRYARQHEAETRAAYLNTNRATYPRKEVDPVQYAFKRHPKGTVAKTAVANMVGDPEKDKTAKEESDSSSDDEDAQTEQGEGADTPLEDETFDDFTARMAEVYAARNPDWKANIICHECKKKGHFKRECPSLAKDIKHEKKTGKSSGNARAGAAE